MYISKLKHPFYCIACIQFVFFFVFLFFRDNLYLGYSPFRITTYEEWNWILDQGGQNNSWLYGILELMQIVLSIWLIRCFFDYYWKRHMKTSDIIIPLSGLLLYVPVYFFVKYKAEHYYLWMSSIPLEIASLILFCLLCSNKPWRSEDAPLI